MAWQDMNFVCLIVRVKNSNSQYPKTAEKTHGGMITIFYCLTN